MNHTEQDQAANRRIQEIAAFNGGNRFDADELNVTRDPNTGRIIHSKDYGSDEALNVRFSMEEVFSKAATFDNGGIPTYEQMEFITIMDKDNRVAVHAPVTDFYEWRFPVEYDRFKRGTAEVTTGTPLADWALLQRAHIRELNRNGISSVEQLAALPDHTGGSLRQFMTLKLKAIQWLADRDAGTKEAELQAQLAERDDKLARLEAMVAQLLAAQTAQVPPKAEKKLYGAAAKSAAKKKEAAPNE